MGSQHASSNSVAHAASSVIQGVCDQALALHKQGKFAEAISLYNKLLNRSWDDDTLRFYLADALLQIECNGLAINLLQAIVSKNDKHALAWCNMGVGFRKEGFIEEAKTAWAVALKLAGDSAEVCGNMAGLYADCGEPDKAILWCDRALKCDPASVQARWQKSLALLTKRQWEAGWAHYEYRRQQDNWDPRRTVDVPNWTGGPLKPGELLYLHGEQGVGDEIMFLAMLPTVLATVPQEQIILEINPKVIPLAAATWPAITYIARESDLATDAHSYLSPCISAKLPVGSLATMYWGDGPLHDAPYLSPRDDLVAFQRRRLAALGPGPYVALAWLGGAKSTRVLDRSMALSTMQPLMNSYTCVSAQYGDFTGPLAQEREAAGLAALDPQASGEDMEAQAALFMACDAVVTVAQTAMHVAGAIGAPAYVLLPHGPDWRFGVTGHDIPFYSSVRLIRRSATDTWQRSIDTVMRALDNQFRKKEVAA